VYKSGSGSLCFWPPDPLVRGSGSASKMSRIPQHWYVHVTDNENWTNFNHTFLSKKVGSGTGKTMPIRPDPDQQATLYLGVLRKGGRAEAGIATHCLMSIRSTSMAARSNMLWMKVPSRPSSCFCTATWSKICKLRRGKQEDRLCTLYSRRGKESEEGTRKVVFVLCILDEAKNIEEGTRKVVFVLCILDEAKNIEEGTRKVVFVLCEEGTI
jgi:hypothetical protein